MAASKFNFAERNAGGKKKQMMQGAIARRMAAKQEGSAKDQAADATDVAAMAARNKQVGR